MMKNLDRLKALRIGDHAVFLQKRIKLEPGKPAAKLQADSTLCHSCELTVFSCSVSLFAMQSHESVSGL